MGKSGDPEGEASTAANTLSRRDPKMQAAKVHMLNGTSKDFELHRGSDGDVLFNLVSTELSIEERDYFSLCFYDEQGIRHWMYNDKKILRQLKGLPWEFSFEVKFYPTAPSTLNDDNARYNLFLQLRKDIATARLPATIPTHALLAAFIAQSEYGDADVTVEYEKYLRGAQFVPSMKEEQNLEKVKELHREQKGLTASEAESRYLDTCKQLSMYGVFVFNAMDSQHQDVGIGVCASGINVYKDTIRMHRFSWQNIVKISYRKNSFTVKLKAGELDNKKETTLAYKVRDYLSAKRIWKCGVEHHTFFRLIQPEDKPKGGLFRWGSTRFRYQGRTQFQTKMASQMFDHPTGTTQRTSPGRLTQSCDNVNKENVPVHDDKAATLGREGKIPSPTVSPGVSYEIGSSSKRAGSTNGKVGTPLDSDDELVYTPVETPTSAAYYLSERSSLRSPYSSGAVSPNEWSASSTRGEVLYRHTSARRNLFGTTRASEDSSDRVRLVSFHEPPDQHRALPDTARYADLEHIPIQQSVQLYHRGFYNEPPEEPTVRIVRYAPRNGVPAVERLEPINEMDAHPIRFFVNLHHSGESHRVRISRHRHSGVEDVAEIDPANYVFHGNQGEPTAQIRRVHDLVPASLIEHSAVYYAGKDSTTDRAERPNYRLITRILPTSNVPPQQAQPQQPNEHEHQPSQPSSSNTDTEQSRRLPSRDKGKKGKSTTTTTTTTMVSGPSSAYALSSDRYKGPLESVDRKDDLANLPLEHHPRVTYVTKTTTIVEKPSKAAPTDEEQVETENRHFRYIARIRHEGDEDVVDKEHVRPELYGLPSTSYDGPLEDTTRDDDLEHLPIQAHSTVYHSGQSWLKTKPTEPAKVKSSEPHEVKTTKTAVLHVKSPVKPVLDEEKPEVRLLARVLPAEVDDSRDVVVGGKPHDTSSSKFGFFKGKKGKSTTTTTTTTVVSGPLSAYALSSDRYEGPLESVDRKDDLANLPLEHHPRVPYVTKTTTIVEKPSKAASTDEEQVETENRQFRYIARIRHDGDEDVVDKEHVRPELYGLPSTSYDGPLEDTTRDDDLEHLPIQAHSTVYHSGQSWLKTKPTEPAKVKSSEPHEVKTTKTAVLHVKSPVKPVLDEEKPEVRLLARVLPAEVDDSRDVVVGVKPHDTSSSKFGFFKGKKGKSTTTTTTTTVVSGPASAYALSSDRYEGPLESVDRKDDLANLPLEHHPRVPYVTKTTTIVEKPSKAAPTDEEQVETENRHFRYIARIRHEGDEDVVDKEHVRPELYGLPSTSYDGPLEDTTRDVDLEHLPIQAHSTVYHSGQSWLKTKPTEPAKVKSSEPHEVKTTKTAVLHVKSPVKPVLDEEKPEVRLLARVLPAEVDDSRDVVVGVKPHDTSSSKFGFFKGKKGKSTTTTTTVVSGPASAYALSSDRYEGPLESVDRKDDLANLPLEHHPRVPYVTKTTTIVEKPSKAAPTDEEQVETENRHFRYIARIRHEGDEDVVDKEHVRPELYGLPSTSYDGPLEDTTRDVDLEHLPIQAHSTVYHSGQSWLKTKPTEPAKVKSSEPHEVKTTKTAVLHVKSPVKPVLDEEKPEVRLLARVLPAEVDDSRDVVVGVKPHDTSSSKLGFFKGKKGKSTTTTTTTTVVSGPASAYALSSDRYEGPLESVDRKDDLANLPLEHHPRVPYVTKTTTIVEKPSKAAPTDEEQVETENRHFRYIARIRHEGDEDVVDKEHVRPELYGLPSTSYDGPLEDTTRDVDLEHLPIQAHSTVYHSGQSWLKTKPTEPAKVKSSEPHEVKTTKTAVLHVKSPVKPVLDEEKPEVRLLARVLPAEVDDSRDVVVGVKPHDTSSSKFGFFKGKKGKSTTTTTTTTVVSGPASAYALSSDRYEGPLESVDRKDDLANLPLEHHPRVPYVTKTTTIVEKPSKAAPTDEEQVETENRHFRYIARIRHEGDEDVVDKEHVRPELYGLPSTSYDGPLEDTTRDVDLEHLPIQAHSTVYHSGQSWLKTKPTEPAKVKSSEPHEVKTTKTAVLHVKSPVKPVLDEEKPEVRLLARVLPAEVDDSRDVVVGVKPHDTSSSKFGFFKGKKGKSTTTTTTTTVVSGPASAYALSSDRYEGPLESVDRKDDLANLPLEHHPRVPYVTKTTTIVEKPSKAAPTDEEQVETENRHFRYIARIRHEGDEDVVDKEHVRPELYGLPSTSYDGPLEDTTRDDDLEHLSIQAHSTVYHSGQSWLKTKPTEPAKVKSSEPHEVKTTKTAVLHVKSPVKPVLDEEKPEVRLLARVLPAEVDDSRDVVVGGKPHDTSSSKFGFFKGKKGKSTTTTTTTTTVVSGPSSAYALSSDRYEGPLESVDRKDDLANLPLEHHPRVPYVTKTTTIVEKPSKAAPTDEEQVETENRHFRYIARIRHDGDEDVVDKEHVRPELYGLPSTSYDGPLEDTTRDDDLEHLPIQAHSTVYHSGQSWLKTKPTEPAKVKSSEPHEVKTTKTAVLHVKSPVKPVLDEEKPEVRLLARVLPAEVDDSRDVVVGGKPHDTSSSKFGFFKGKKGKSTTTTTTVVSGPSSAYALSSDRYEGPLESVDRKDDLANLPLEHHPRVPYVTKTTTIVEKPSKAAPTDEEQVETENRHFRYIARIRHEGDEDVVDKEHVRPELYGLPSTSYDGPLEDTTRDDDLEHLPIQAHSTVYHSGQSWLKTKPTEPAKVKSSEPHEVKTTKTAVLHVKSPVKPVLDEEKPEVRLLARVLPAEVDDSRDVVVGVKPHDTSSSKFGFFKGKKGKSTTTTTTTTVVSGPASAYALSSDRYEGPLESVDRKDDLANLPLEHHPRVPYVTKTTTIVEKPSKAAPTDEEQVETENRHFRYIARIRHEGDEDVVDKEHVRPELYGLPSTSYDGPLEDTTRDDDLEHLSIQAHSTVYHSGQSWLKTKPTEPAKVKSSEPHEVKTTKTAVLHVKSPVKPVLDEEKPEVRLLARVLPAEVDDSRDVVVGGKPHDTSSSKFGFFKGKKGKSTTTTTTTTTVVSGPSSAYALSSDRYEGPLESVDRKDDLANLPLEHHPRVPYVTKTTTIVEKPSKAAPTDEEQVETENRHFRYIARIRHDGDEDVVHKEHVRPELYGLPSTSYDGPLEDTTRDDDLEHLPIQAHSTVYHSGQSWLKTKPTEPAKVKSSEPHEVKTTKTAVLHVKSPVKPVLDEEKPEVRLLARVLPAEVDDSRDVVVGGKPHDTSSSKFGFFKGKKGKSTTTTTTVVSGPSSAYALSSDRYEGPLESVDRKDDLANLPLEHHPRVPYITKTTTIVEKPSKAAPTDEEQVETENRHFRYIARIRHEGDEDVVDKEHVRPELYGLPSTSYDGPLEDTTRDDDLEHLPIQAHSTVYHSGQSWLKTKPTEPAKVKSSEPHEVKTTKTAVLHVKSPVKPVLDEEKPEVRLLARVLPAEVDDSRDVVVGGKPHDASSSKFGFFKRKKGKSTTTTTTTTTVVSGPSSAYALSSDRYEGPLESVDRKDDLANLPLEHHPRVPYVTKTTTIVEKPSKAAPTDEEQVETENRHFRYIARIRHEGDEDVVDKEHVRPELYGLPSTSYDGPLEDTTRDDDLEHLPIQAHSTVYHSGQSWLKTKPTEPAKVKSSEPHEVKTTKTAVLHVKSPVKPVLDEEKPEVRLLARVLPAEVDDSRDVVVGGKPHDASSSKFGFFKRKKGKSTTTTTTTTTVVSGPSSAYALSSDRYEGPLESVDRKDDLANLPLEHHPRVPYVTKTTTIVEKPSKAAPTDEEQVETENRHFRYIARIRHDGDEDVVDKEHVRPELYSLPSTSYDGPLEDTTRDDDLEHLPIQAHSTVYHSGQSWLKTKPTEPAKVKSSEPHEVKTTKTAVLHVKSPVKPVLDEEKPEVRLLARVLPAEVDDSRDVVVGGKPHDTSSSKFGFFKGKKGKSTTTTTTTTTVVSGPSSAYALSSDRYEGPLESVDRKDDLANLPLEHHPRVPYVTKTTTIVEKPSKAAPTDEEQVETENRHFRYIARIRHDGDEDVVDKEHVRPELYGLPSTSYDGPLEDTTRDDDLEHLPIQAHSTVYHSGQSWLKTKPTEPAKVKSSEPHEVKTTKAAVLHVKSPVKPVLDEEKPEVRLLARVLPAEVDDSRDVVVGGKPHDTSSSKFGFFKGKKGKSTTTTTTTTTVVSGPSSAYALSSDRYEGPLESVDRKDDLANLPLEHHPRVPYVTKTTTIVEKPSKAAPTDEEQVETENRHFRYIARIRHDGDEDVVDKEHVRPELYGLPSTSYDGPLEDTTRDDDLEHLPIQAHSTVYHSGQSWLKTKPTEPAKVKSSEPHEVKTTKAAVLHVKSPVKPVLDEEKPEVRLLARVLPAEVDDSRDVVVGGKPHDTSSSKFGFFKGKKGKSTTTTTTTTTVVSGPSSAYALSSDRYEGPLESVDRKDDLANLPLEHHPRVPYVTKTTTIVEKPSKAAPTDEEQVETENRHFRYIARIRHDGDEDVVDKEHVRPELYGLPSTSYDGPLEDTTRDDDLEHLPIQAHSTVYHSGQSWLKTKPTEPAKVKSSEPHEVKITKTAVLHVKSPVNPVVDEEKPEVRLLARVLPAEVDDSRDVVVGGKPHDTSSSKLGFFKGKKGKSTTSTTTTTVVSGPSSAYALSSDRYEGPLESVDRSEDLVNLPLDHHLSDAYTTASTLKVASTARHAEKEGLDGRHYVASTSYHSEGTTMDGQEWIEVRVERRVEVQLEPVFCLTGAGLGAVSEDECGLIFTATPPPMAPAGRSFLSLLGFKTKKSKKSKGEHEVDSSESSSSDEDHHVKVVPVVETASPTVVEPNSSGKLVRHETKEQSYRLSGEGRSSGFNPEHPSLSTTIAEAERLNQRSPRLEHAERTITVRALAPLPVSFEESGQPHTTVATWQERTQLPDNVTVEYDDQGNRITRTVKTSQVKHTVQKQTFQNYVVPDGEEPSSTLERSREQMTPLGLQTHTGPIVDTQSRSVVYEATSPSQGDEGLGEFVSSKTVTSGNRTIETITYKTERDGIIETHVEHRVTIHSEDPIDHDAELSAAIAEATQMNPDMTVEKIEVRQETSS